MAVNNRLTLRWRRGTTLMEVLVASLIVSFCVTGLVNVWYFAVNMTVKTNDLSTSINLARQQMETIKETGFTYTSEAPATSPIVHYYDINENNVDSTPSSARYTVSTTVVSDATVSGSNPVTPTNTALRTVTVTVALKSSGATLYQLVSYLARSGV